MAGGECWRQVDCSGGEDGPGQPGAGPGCGIGGSAGAAQGRPGGAARSADSLGKAGAAWAAGVPGAHGRSHAAAEFRAAALPAPGVQAWSAAGSLRHTFATLAALGGVPMHVTARQLGHSTTRMIAEVYSHVLPEMQREVVRRVRAVAERNDTQKHNTQDHS